MTFAAVDLKHHPLQGISLIEASAGTGKTYTITHLYLRCLLETDYEVQQILVVTFTNAATQELNKRIRKLISEVWGYVKYGKFKDPMLEQLFSDYKNDENALLKLQKALVNFDEAAIYSIHGFCQRLLNTYPLDMHSMLEQNILADEQQLKREAATDFWRKHVINQQIEKLRWIHSQWKTPEDLLRDCNPLTGYEQTVARVKQESENLQLDEQVNELWNQLSEKWTGNRDELVDVMDGNPSLNARTYNSKAVKTLIQVLDEIFQQPVAYQLPEKWILLSATKLNSSLKKNQQDDRIHDDFFIIAETLQHLHSSWLQQQKLELLIQATESISNNVALQKKQTLQVSFDDLVHQVSEVLIQGNEHLLQNIRQTFPVAMVDEFQDTDHKQYAIFNSLYPPQAEDESNEHELNTLELNNHELSKYGLNKHGLILIGDPKQAIYSFRGADVFTYQQARLSTRRQFTLDTNFRSTTAYIELLNQLFSNNEQAFIYEQLISFHASRASGTVEQIVQQDEPAKPLVTWLSPYQQKPMGKGQASEYFANICAHEIQQILIQQTLRVDGNPVQAKDLAILVKKGSQASLMKNKLAQLGIPSALISRDSVFTTEQAREITLLLEVLVDTGNIKRVFGLLSSDLFGWHAKQIQALQDDDKKLVELLEQIKSYHQHWLDKGILSMFFRLLDEQKTLQNNSQSMEGERRMTNWVHLMELLQDQSLEHASINQTLAWLRSQRDQSDRMASEAHQLRLESDRNLVRIVTIHKSKGLEYPVVFLPFMWDAKGTAFEPKSYPVHDEDGNKDIVILDESRRYKWRQENLAEEIRLFYVAMTRAKYRCYLGWGNIAQAGGSAIAHCLYAPYLDKSKLPPLMDIPDSTALRAGFEQLNKDKQRVEIRDQFTFSDTQLLLDTDHQKQAEIKKFSRIMEQPWRISSYSQIASQGHSDQSHRPDYDAVTLVEYEEPVAEQADNRFNFHKGAKAGNFLHDILEHQEFNAEVDEVLIQQKLQEYGFEDHWLSSIKSWIGDILSCDLNGFSLNKIIPQQKISEMEFYMSCKHLKSDSLNELLLKYKYRQDQQLFSFKNINGFLKGFIDLTFEYQGQYYVADYKSNYLGAGIENYTREACEQSMYEHNYHLQFLVYTLALHRFLHQRLADYDYDRHVGGVYYLFLRGMSAETNNKFGVYFHKPPREVIYSLDRLFNKDE